MATPAGFSAPPVLKVVVGGIADFVGDPNAVAIEVIGTIAVLFADRVGAVPMADICDVVMFAGLITKPVLAVALGAGVGTTVAFNEVTVGAA